LYFSCLFVILTIFRPSLLFSCFLPYFLFHLLYRPPPGGFAKPSSFPETGFRKISPVRGPAGYIAIAIAGGLMTFGLVNHFYDVNERNYYNLSRFNAKFERAYVLQAQEEVRWQRRQKELLDSERELMKNVPGWVVGQRRYYTSWEDRPNADVFDKRKIGNW
jgi:hypothetical protein